MALNVTSDFEMHVDCRQAQTSPQAAEFTLLHTLGHRMLAMQEKLRTSRIFGILQVTHDSPYWTFEISFQTTLKCAEKLFRHSSPLRQRTHRYA
jgi:hypothetical protein